MGHEPPIALRSAALGKVIRQYITDVLTVNERDGELQRKQIAKLEAEGYRIVTGGQTDGYDSDGDTSFDLRDWRTHELIFEDRGTLDDFDRMWDKYDPGGRFYHYDRVADEVPVSDLLPPTPEGLPDSLAEVLRDWATNNEDEARNLVGVQDHD